MKAEIIREVFVPRTAFPRRLADSDGPPDLVPLSGVIMQRENEKGGKLSSELFGMKTFHGWF